MSVACSILPRITHDDDQYIWESAALYHWYAPPSLSYNTINSPRHWWWAYWSWIDRAHVHVWGSARVLGGEEDQGDCQASLRVHRVPHPLVVEKEVETEDEDAVEDEEKADEDKPKIEEVDEEAEKKIKKAKEIKKETEDTTSFKKYITRMPENQKDI
jgi:molecular chaperone HtpG